MDPVFMGITLFQAVCLLGMAACNERLASTFDGIYKVPGLVACVVCTLGAFAEIGIAFDLIRPYRWFI